MSDDVEPPDPESSTANEPEWQRRRRLAAVFGVVLPDTTTDEADDQASDPTPDPDDDTQDRWLRSQVPPHHG